MSTARHQPTNDSFGARMRYERERRGIRIASIAETTKILPQLLERMERNDVARWPTGLYRRSFIRAYATAIGLDPETVVNDFLTHFPDPEDAGEAPTPISPANHNGRVNVTLRLTLAEAGSQFSARNLVREWRRRCQAIVIDAAILSVFALLLSAVFGEPWAPFSVTVALYYLASVLLLGNTPGVTLVASWPPFFTAR